MNLVEKWVIRVRELCYLFFLKKVIIMLGYLSENIRLIVDLFNFIEFI